MSKLTINKPVLKSYLGKNVSVKVHLFNRRDPQIYVGTLTTSNDFASIGIEEQIANLPWKTENSEIQSIHSADAEHKTLYEKTPVLTKHL